MVTNATFSTSHRTKVLRRSHLRHASATAVVLAALLSTPACAQKKEAAEVPASSGEAVANLPFARGKTFHTLDEYLAHLEAQGAVDLPWWREIRPGVYQRVTSMPESRPEVATREELMRRFGFRR